MRTQKPSWPGGSIPIGRRTSCGLWRRLERSRHRSQRRSENGARLRTYRWRDRRGWSYSHRDEVHLDGTGMARPKDDHFEAPGGDVVRYSSPKGKEMTKVCIGSVDFVPLDPGHTKVTAIHKHSLEGGTWPWRIRMENADRGNTAAAFRDWIDRCRKMAGSASDSSRNSDRSRKWNVTRARR